MSLYQTVFIVHVACAAISISFFVVRGIWMLNESPLLTRKFTRIAPHIIDSLLLASAIVLTVLIAQYPFVQSWLTVKVFALIAYIVLGMIALKRGKTKQVRALAFVSAILMFAFIVSVAWFHDPLGGFSLFR